LKIWYRRLFLVASVGGGFSGIAITSTQLFRSGQPPIVYLIYIAVSAAYAAGIYGGIKLIEDEARGLSLLSWYFLVQIPAVSSPVITYLFWSGFSMYLSGGSNGFNWRALYGARWLVNLLRPEDVSVEVGINLFALWATWFLRRELSRLRARPLPDPPQAPGTSAVGEPPPP